MFIFIIYNYHFLITNFFLNYSVKLLKKSKFSPFFFIINKRSQKLHQSPQSTWQALYEAYSSICLTSTWKVLIEVDYLLVIWLLLISRLQVTKAKLDFASLWTHVTPLVLFHIPKLTQKAKTHYFLNKNQPTQAQETHNTRRKSNSRLI